MPTPGEPSRVQLARLVQTYLAEPGASIEQKAARVGVRRNVLLRAARRTISRTARPRRQRKRGFT